jgi:4-amino-4-deoxy-L-arabinose transferase-like glycosyltransferase
MGERENGRLIDADRGSSSPLRPFAPSPLLLLLILSAIFFFYRLGSVPLLGPDEPRYAQVAREMWQRGDLITPTIGGYLWAEKPALLYWLMMVGMWVLGVTEWAARLPSAVLATLAVLAVYYTGQRMVSERFGFLSGLALIVNVMFASFAHGASTDMPVTAMITLGLCGFWLFEAEPGDRKSRWILAAYGWFGLALLAKGLIGVMLPAGIIGVYLVLTRQLGKLRDLRWLPGLAILLVLALIWYAPVTARHGWAFINEFFISHHFQRFTSTKFHHPGPVYYFIPVILGGVFPWTAFLLSATGRLRWSQLQTGDSQSRWPWFCAVWIVGPLLFFSFSTSKLPGYIVPVLPAAAFLVAGELERLLEKGADRALKLSWYATALLVWIVGVAGITYARRELHPDDMGNILILVVTVMTGAALLFFGPVRKFRAAIASLVVGCAVSFTLVSHFYLPAIADKESLYSLAQVALREMKPGEKLVGYYYFHHTLTFYTDARSFYDEKGNVIIATSPDELIDRVGEHGSVLCVTRQEVFHDMVKDARLRFQWIGQQRDIVLVRVMEK